MNGLFENNNTLSAPFEAFLFDTKHEVFPVKAHWHYFFEIVYMLEGTADIICNGIHYNIPPTHMILFMPQSVHAIYSASGERLSYLVLKFDINKLSFSSDYLPKFQYLFHNGPQVEKLPIHFSQSNCKELSLELLFRKCVAEITERKYGYDICITSNISLLLIAVIRIWKEYGFQPQRMINYESNGKKSIQDILLYIDEHISEHLQVCELAKMCNMSYSYFAKNFHTLYNQSCKEYIDFVRLSKAENLLLFTDFDLSYISSETGFSDCSHLIRVFKKRYGITPKQLRTSSRQSHKEEGNEVKN